MGILSRSFSLLVLCDDVMKIEQITNQRIDQLLKVLHRALVGSVSEPLFVHVSMRASMHNKLILGINTFLQNGNIIMVKDVPNKH